LLIAIVRHGETDSNAKKLWVSDQDLPLNEKGRGQAEKVAYILKPYNFELIVSSDKIRAIETANIISNKLEISVVKTDPIFRDRFYGEVEGLTSAQIFQKYGIKMTNSLNEDIDKLMGTEKIPQFGMRVKNGLISLLRDYGDKKIILVTHGAFARMFYRIYHGNDDNIYFYNCGNTIFECNKDNCILVRDVVNLDSDDSS